ncbi:MAG TPA: PASTA domain-containing protein, partial [Candidatus Limnocylindria bacterium]|nr:PASTA domain-containing protein [Candidatus Limnocylindria bacterium]
APPRRAEPRRPGRRSRTNLWGVIGTLLVLAAAGLVIVLIVLPLLDLGGGGGSADATPSPTAAPSQVIQPNVVPETVGRSTQEAIEIARAAGLNWTVRCNEDPSQPEGIIDQEPPAGTEVAPGSAFTMFSARIADCR